MERMDASSSYSEVARHVTEMVQIAEEAGFHIVWSAEHHGIEMTIAAAVMARQNRVQH